jgi:CheY-like chemotaxis protein
MPHERRRDQRRADFAPGWERDGFLVAGRREGDGRSPAGLPVGSRLVPGRPPLVLVADDDPAIRHLLCAVLEAADYRTDTAADGEEVIDRVRTARPDVIVLDVLMPRMDGYTTLTRLNGEVTLPPPVIMLTGRPEPIYGECWRRGRRHLTKPVSAEHLVEAVRHVLTPSPGPGPAGPPRPPLAP